MKDLRTISLCVLYKMVSKLLVNWLKRCLVKCVSYEQLTFIKGRSILDNVLIDPEITHAMKGKAKGWRGELALKIYIRNAYDWVGWVFLRGVLVKMGFKEFGGR
jgi:hypothetical protein